MAVQGHALPGSDLQAWARGDEVRGDQVFWDEHVLCKTLIYATRRFLTMPSSSDFEKAKMDMRRQLKVLRKIRDTIERSGDRVSRLSELSGISQEIFLTSCALYSACIEFHTLKHYDEWKPVFQELQGMVATVQRYVREFNVSPGGTE